MRPIPPSVLTFSFGSLFGLTVIVARAIAVTATEPWFSPASTTLVYLAGVVAPASAAISAVYIAAGRAALAGHRSEIDVPSRRRPAGSEDQPRAGPGGDRATRDPMSLRAETAEAQRRIWTAVAPPVVIAFVLAGIAAAMLPGAEGFATTNYGLNATFILTFAYGWWLVLLWTMAAIVGLPSPHRDPS